MEVCVCVRCALSLCMSVCVECAFVTFPLSWARCHRGMLRMQASDEWWRQFARETEQWRKGGRWLTFTLQILYQPLISTVTPQEKDFPLWIIVHFNSLINQFMPRCLGNLGYLFSMWAVHACLSCESQKRGEEEGRTFRNREIIYSIWKQGVR